MHIAQLAQKKVRAQYHKIHCNVTEVALSVNHSRQLYSVQCSVHVYVTIRHISGVFQVY